MSPDSDTRLAAAGLVEEMAHRLLYFSRALPPSTELCVGFTLAECMACLIEDQGEAAEMAWLIEIMGDATALLATTLRENYLAKSDGQ